jgi:adenosine deaminase
MRVFFVLHRIRALNIAQTDDTLPFRNSVLTEYALLLAKPPLGLGWDKATIAEIAQRGMESRFIK